jgi:peptide-methionine (S)-S-oxide reductase
VIRTRVGYSGGEKVDPTYHDLGDHTETIQIDYDPAVISYQDLLDIFWKSHNPLQRSWSRQYMAAVFYHNEGQRRLAEQSRDRRADATQRKISTQILPATEFYRAEDYHQKYGLRRDGRLMGEYAAIYPDNTDFVDSTAVARVNGYLSGYGSPESLEKELADLGLSKEASERLWKIVSKRRNRLSGL